MKITITKPGDLYVAEYHNLTGTGETPLEAIGSLVVRVSETALSPSGCIAVDDHTIDAADRVAAFVTAQWGTIQPSAIAPLIRGALRTKDVREALAREG